MDVYVGLAFRPAVHFLACQPVAVDDVHGGHVAGGGLCSRFRHVCQLSAQRGGSARVAAYGGERI